MTDLEIDRALALAIGHRASEMYTDREGNLWLPERGCWRVFSHKDWNVIGPIAERYNRFSFRWANGRWGYTNGKRIKFADTPQKAIALAVIRELT